VPSQPKPELSESQARRASALGPLTDLLEDPRVAHRDDSGELTGFEVKNRGFTGFAAGGTRSARQSAACEDDRVLVVIESVFLLA
jgi:hypothetical protein